MNEVKQEKFVEFVANLSGNINVAFMDNSLIGETNEVLYFTPRRGFGDFESVNKIHARIILKDVDKSTWIWKI